MYRRHALGLVLAALAAVFSAPLAIAQYGLSNPLIGLKTAPPVTRSDIRIMDSILGLDESQKALTGALYDDFFDRYRVEAAAIEAEIIAMLDDSIITQDSEITRDAENKAEEWEKRRLEWRTEFLTDLRLLLDQQQVELWPKVERELRRHDLLGDGRIAGESVDLIRLVDSHVQDWSASTELVEELDRYADRLDRALIARRNKLKEFENMVFWRIMEDDPYRAKELYEDAIPTRVRVRDVNLGSLQSVLKHLSEDDATALERAFYTEALRNHSPASPIESRIRAASSLPSLSSEQREQIRGILEEYEPRKHRAIVAFYEAIAEMEAEMLPNNIANKIAQDEHDASGADPAEFFVTRREPEAIRDTLRDRLEIDKATWLRISAVLTPSQRAEMPRPEESIIWFREFLLHEI